MRIAIVSSNLFKIPPDKAHAVQWITSVLVENLHARGHEVTLFGPGNSKVSASLYSIIPQSLDEIVAIDWRHKGEHLSFDTALAIEAYKRSNDFDIIHFSLGTWENLVFLNNFAHANLVVTLHDPLVSPHFQTLAPLLAKIPNLHFVSISNAQRIPLPDLTYIDTVYNGIDIGEFTFQENADDYFCWLGRLSSEKGLDNVLVLGQKERIKVKVSPLIWPWKKAYWERNYAHFINGGNIQLVNLTGQRERNKFLANARAFLSPIEWEEPFGLVMTEAMACGTPVISYARGSVSEIMIDGVTGFIVNSSDKDIRGDWIVKKTGMEGLIEAVHKLESLNAEEYKRMRQACRKHVEEKFTVEKMVEGYEKVYKKILSNNR